ncbi:MAG: recombinase family protein [Ornithinimicrobium sp.]
MPSTVGYARVSTHDQDTTAQVKALESAGANRIFTDHGQSARRSDRPQWVACQEYLRPEDTLLVWRLDRLAGTQTMAIETINHLHDIGVHIKSLTEPDIDTTTPMGRALFGIVAVFAQLRVDTIRENTKAGLARARAEGRVGGRPSVMTSERVDLAVKLRADGQSLDAIASILGVGRSSISRALDRREN